jgi:hypothetical protein
MTKTDKKWGIFMSSIMTPNYDARLCISYLDESEAYEAPKRFYKSMVSLTALKSIYIQGLENDWKNLRVKYNVPQGVYLHFSSIKNLLKQGLTKINDPVIQKIFSKIDGSIDYNRIYNFYSDIQSIIRQNQFIVQATGIEYPKEKINYPKGIKLNSVMYQLFYEHLDRMAFYLMDLGLNDYQNRKKTSNNAKFKFFFSKLRYDGSYDLNERNDYRNAFSHCISDGTKHFNSSVTKEVFDTLSFVAKEEVGKCINCPSACSYEFVSHAGDELVDYIALYVARDMWKDSFKDYMVNDEGVSSQNVDELINELTTITVPGFQPLVPIDDIKPKLFSTQHIASYKLIKDYPY